MKYQKIVAALLLAFPTWYFIDVRSELWLQNMGLPILLGLIIVYGVVQLVLMMHKSGVELNKEIPRHDNGERSLLDAENVVDAIDILTSGSDD